jgi:hypothetical protein
MIQLALFTMKQLVRPRKSKQRSIFDFITDDWEYTYWWQLKQ